MINLADGDIWVNSDLLSHQRLNLKTNLVSGTDPTNTIGAGQVWVDTSGSECLLKFRNKANGAWLDYFDQAVKQASGPTFDHLHLTAGLEVGSAIVSDTADTDSLGSTSKEWLNIYVGSSGRLYFGTGQEASLRFISGIEMGVGRDWVVGADALVGTPSASNSAITLLAAAGGGTYVAASLDITSAGVTTLATPHNLVVTANDGVQFDGNLTFTSTQTVDGRDISADLNQAVQTGSGPTFDHLHVTNDIAGATLNIGSSVYIEANPSADDTVALLHRNHGQFGFWVNNAYYGISFNNDGSVSFGDTGGGGVVTIDSAGAITGNHLHLAGLIDGVTTLSMSNQLVISMDDANADPRQLLIRGATDTNKQLMIGYNTTGNYGSIQAIQQTVDVKPLILQPDGSNVGIGIITPVYTIDAYGSIASRNYAAQGSLRTIRGNGTLASPTAIVNGNLIGQIGSMGYYDATHLIMGADILIYAVGDFTSTTVHPTDMVFRTSPSGSDIIEGMRLTSAGNLNVAGYLQKNSLPYPFHIDSTSGLKIYMPLNNIVGKIAYDISGNGNSGSITTGNCSELWIGGIEAFASSALLQPTNNFTLIDGTVYTNIVAGYLEKIIGEYATAFSGLYSATASDYTGCMATFKCTTGSDIARVTGPFRGATTGDSITVTVTAPINGNVCIAVIGLSDGGAQRTVSSITQTNVTWTKIIDKQYVYARYNDCEIWIGIVSASAGTSAVVALSGNATDGAVANICEYSGVATSSYTDQTASASGQATGGYCLTGTTAVNVGMWSVGKFGNGLRMEGPSDYVYEYVTVPYSTSFPFATNAWTVSFWMKADTGYAYSVPFFAGDNGTYEGIGIAPYINGIAGARNGVSLTESNLFTTTIDNTFHHLTLTYDGANFRCYTDGVLTGTKAWTSGVTGGLPLYIGKWWGPSFHGVVDDFRVYNRVLSAIEVLGVYQSGELQFPTFGENNLYKISSGLQSPLVTYGGLYVNPNTTGAQLTIENSGGTEGTLIAHATAGVIFGSMSNHQLLIRTNNTNALTIDTSQNAQFAGALTVAGDISIGATKKLLFVNENGIKVNWAGNCGISIEGNALTRFFRTSAYSANFVWSLTADSASFTDLMSLSPTGNLTVAGQITASNGLIKLVGVGQLYSDTDVRLVVNAYYDGTNWNQINTGVQSWQTLSHISADWAVYHWSAGVTPVNWVKYLEINATGKLTTIGQIVAGTSFKANGDASSVDYWVNDNYALRNSNNANANGNIYLDFSNVIFRRANDAGTLMSLSSAGNLTLNTSSVGGITLQNSTACNYIKFLRSNAGTNFAITNAYNADKLEFLALAYPNDPVTSNTSKMSLDSSGNLTTAGYIITNNGGATNTGLLIKSGWLTNGTVWDNSTPNWTAMYIGCSDFHIYGNAYTQLLGLDSSGNLTVAGSLKVTAHQLYLAGSSDAVFGGVLAGYPSFGISHYGDTTYGSMMFTVDDWDFAPQFSWVGSRTGNVGMSLAVGAGNLMIKGTANISSSIVINGNQIRVGDNVNDFYALYFNYVGYADGATQFRDTYIYNGKGGAIANFVGASGQVQIPTVGSGGGLLIGGDAGFYRSAANTISLFSGDALTDFTLNGGTAILFSSFKGANSDGNNIFVGGGGQSSVGAVGSTYLGSDNSAFGMNALLGNTTGFYNSAFGHDALLSNTTGYDNSAFGMNALLGNTTGFYNSAFGWQALSSITTGTNNTAIGYSTGMNLTTGSDNTIIGANINCGNVSNNIILADGDGVVRLQFDNTGKATFNQDVSIGDMTGTGGVAVYHNNGVLGVASSSVRYKENITDLIDTSWIYQLRPVNFTFKNPKVGVGVQMGLIAEEVEQIYPQLIWKNKEGLTEGIHYDRLVIPLLAEVQSLKREIDLLKLKLKANKND
jgi:hypothetical protein